MRFKIVCCEILYREICHLLAESPNTCSVTFLPKGLHDLGVDKMQPRLQENIDRIEEDGDCDAILLGYGLCNNGTVGLTARSVPLVIPRAHDCIALFLGCRGRYKEYFDSHPGTYYKTSGWIERNDTESAGEETVSQRLGLSMQYDELVEKYGEDNAQYIMETMGDPCEHYDRITFIDMGLPCDARFREQAAEEARERGWAFDVLEGSLKLLRKMLDGEWDDDFLVLQPGESVKPSHDADVMARQAGGPEPAGNNAG